MFFNVMDVIFPIMFIVVAMECLQKGMLEN